MPGRWVSLCRSPCFERVRLDCYKFTTSDGEHFHLAADSGSRGFICDLLFQVMDSIEAKDDTSIIWCNHSAADCTCQVYMTRYGR